MFQNLLYSRPPNVLYPLWENHFYRLQEDFKPNTYGSSMTLPPPFRGSLLNSQGDYI